MSFATPASWQKPSRLLDGGAVDPAESTPGGFAAVVRQIARLALAERLAVDNGSLSHEDLQHWHRSLRTVGQRATLLATINLVMLIARRQ